MSEDARIQDDAPQTTQRTTAKTTTTTRRDRSGTTVRERIREYAERPSVWPTAAVILAAVALLLLAMWGWPRIFGRGGDVAGTDRPPIAPAATSALIEIQSEGAGARGANAPVATVAAGPPIVPGGPGPAFAEFYQQRGGLTVFGLPLSEQMQVNGRTVQWFERARLEVWPEFANTPYAVQSGRLGVEFSQSRSFPQQSFFPSRPDLRFFGETGHAVGEPFLSFWANNGGLDTFGYPISEAIPENLADGQLHTVQYFERARLEQHGSQVLVGLLGSALFTRDRDPEAVATPRIVTVPPPTPVPIQ
ncbi:MAG: hypothetical protein H7Y32_00810 [Chloroflexales bacterium]|nr:hypothetical protein [Chloroflexales bacterium]